ncbi:MAG: SH3 domain-containing protein [Agathobacter sp.]|nr:SH3 domain-containing protein [Agathobacter sp.]MBQ2282878.1 SH3 domain-containing protein [Agathobacter sp.]
MKKKILKSFICMAVSLLGLCACGRGTEGIQVTDTAVSGSWEQGIEVLETESDQKLNDTEQDQAASNVEQDQETSDAEQGQATSEAEQDQATSEAEQGQATNEAEQEQEETYTYEELSATMYAKSSVNVRDLPCKDGKQLGKLGQYDKVTVTGKCNETGWYRIQYNNGTAYVSGSYLITESEKTAAEQKAKEEAEKKAKEDADKKTQETTKQEESSKKTQNDSSQESQTNNDNSIKEEEDVSSSDSPQKETKDPEWIMWESASNKYLTKAQKEHIDGMVKKWLNDSSYTNEQLDNDLIEYLVSIGINVGFGEPEPCVDSFGIYKYDDITLNKKKQGRLENYEKMVRDDAGVYYFRAFYTKWEYYDDGSLIVYDCSVMI